MALHYISIERAVADRFRELAHPETAVATTDADIAEHARGEATHYWLTRIRAHKEPDEEYIGEANDRGHR